MGEGTSIQLMVIMVNNTARGGHMQVKMLGGLRPLGPPTMGLQPPLAGLPHESWAKNAIEGAGGP